MCFLKVSLFQLFQYFEVSRTALGPHFCDVGGTWSIIFVILRVLETVWNFDGFYDFPRGHRHLPGEALKLIPRPHTSSQLAAGYRLQATIYSIEACRCKDA